MLYNKSWDKPEIKADPFSLESLIAWLEKQPAHQTYDYIDGRRCLLCQYLTHCGMKNVRVGAMGIYTLDGWSTTKQVPEDFWIVSADFKNPQIWTFGAALDRARKALAER